MVLIIALIGILTSLSAFENQQVPVIPREVLFAEPDFSAPQLSPDGKQLAFLAPVDGVLNIVVRDLASKKDRIVTHEKRSLSWYHWCYDNHNMLCMKDALGNENWNLYRIDLSTGDTLNLTPFENVQVRFVRYSPKHPDRLLIALNKEQGDCFDVYMVHIHTGQLELVEKNPGHIGGFDMEQAWYADDELHIRIAFTIDDNGDTRVMYRDTPDDEWRTIVTWSVDESASSEFVGFGSQPHELYFADGSMNDTSALVVLNPQTGSRSVLAHDAHYDAVSEARSWLYNEFPAYFISPTTGKPAILFSEHDTCKTVILDSTYAHDMTFLETVQPGIVRICSADAHDMWWCVAYVQSDKPNTYYLYNRATHSVEYLACANEELSRYPMAVTKPISYQTRDGLVVHGYLTLPTTTDEHANLPVVLQVHGGPWMRDVWHFDPRVQFFANRGYACLQINYRSSSGYGSAFVRAGNKQWGRAMSHDLVDGAQWLVDQGIADPRKIAIVGRSYGGYAALAGVTFNPDVYACGVALYGMSDLIKDMQQIPVYWRIGTKIWDHRIGDPRTDAVMLKERSPIHHIDAIKAPLLIAHGAHDARIDKSQSEIIVDALRARDIACGYILFSKEGHSLVQAASRAKFYGAVEKFLATHMTMSEKNC